MNEQIARLEDRLTWYKQFSPDSTERIEELKKKIANLQQQLHDTRTN